MSNLLPTKHIGIDDLSQSIVRSFSVNSGLVSIQSTLTDLISLEFLDCERLFEQLISNGSATYESLEILCANTRKRMGRRPAKIKAKYTPNQPKNFKRLIKAAINFLYEPQDVNRIWFGIFPIDPKETAKRRLLAQAMRDKIVKAQIEAEPLIEIKIKDLKAQIKVLENAKGERLSDSSIKTTSSSLNQLIKTGIIDDRHLIRDLIDDYETTDSKVREAIEKGAKGRTWLDSLPRIRRAAEVVAYVDVSKVSFHDYFYILARRRYGEKLAKKPCAEYLTKELKEKHPDTTQMVSTLNFTFRAWMGTRTPSTYGSLQLLKRVCNILNDAGNKLLFKTFYFQSIVHRTPVSTSRSKFTFELTKAQLLEIDVYSQWRLTHSLHEDYENPIEQSFEDELDSDLAFDFVAEDTWTSRPDGICESQTTFVCTYRTAVQVWSTTYKKNASDFSLSCLFDSKYIKALYLDASNSGKFNSRFKVMVLALEACASSSFISTHYPPQRTKTTNELQVYLLKYEPFLRKYVIQLDKAYQIEKSDGKRNVDFILNSDNPADMDEAIAVELKNALDSAPNPRTFNNRKHLSGKENKRAWSIYNSLGRVYTLYMMLGVVPLRIGNYCSLKLIKCKQSNAEVALLKLQEGHCSLYQDYSGLFHIFVPRGFLKNRTGSKTESVDLALTGLQRVIYRYIKIRSEYIEAFGFEDDGYFFVSTNGAKYTETSLGELFSKYTRNAICMAFPEMASPDLMGMNPQGKRHMTATLFLNENPNEYLALATLLMDTLETVLKVYAKNLHRQNAKAISSWAANRNNKAK